MRSLALLAVLVASGCSNPRLLAAALQETQASLDRAHQVHARVCAPDAMARAQSNFDFAELEFLQGNVRRAGEHLDQASLAATEALRDSDPCGTADADDDGIADVVDACPDEPEDLDGDADEDGCRDLDPDDDADLDGIANIDDDCVDVPEDMDGDADEDGCPETSADTDGDGRIDATDRCPDRAEDVDGWEDEDGCPDPDNDLDGVPDILDACPRVKEDVDGWDDEDGCPDPDNDEDGLPDGTDACPDEAGDRALDGCPLQDADEDGVADENDRCPTASETLNGYLDADGCPDAPPARVRVSRQRIELLEAVTFEVGTSTLVGDPAVLDDIAQVLKDAPGMRIRIEGHTDSEGEAATNLQLSERRAGAVRVALVRRGIDGGRIEAVGLGEEQPIDTNRTEAGRARNRRVEVRIIEPGP